MDYGTTDHRTADHGTTHRSGLGLTPPPGHGKLNPASRVPGPVPMPRLEYSPIDMPNRRGSRPHHRPLSRWFFPGLAVPLTTSYSRVG